MALLAFLFVAFVACLFAPRSVTEVRRKLGYNCDMDEEDES